MRATMNQRTCTKCSGSFPETQEFFHTNGKQPSGKQKWKPECKTCHLKTRAARFDELLTEVFGEIACSNCGYNRCVAAIDCHHTVKDDKEFQIAKLRSSYYSLAVIRKELEKCVLLCSNCHREVHAGLLTIKGV